jgi:hypothetical protein
MAILINEIITTAQSGAVSPVLQIRGGGNGLLGESHCRAMHLLRNVDPAVRRAFMGRACELLAVTDSIAEASQIIMRLAAESQQRQQAGEVT